MVSEKINRGALLGDSLEFPKDESAALEHRDEESFRAGNSDGKRREDEF